MTEDQEETIRKMIKGIWDDFNAHVCKNPRCQYMTDAQRIIARIAVIRSMLGMDKDDKR